MNFKAALDRLGPGTSKRQRFVNGSFRASGALFTRLSNWSDDGNRERPCLMQFHHDWQHENCPVMRWYKAQQASSTQFQLVQHRRDCDAPFYHEFILLQLDDGSICRIERTGEGSRVDAVRNFGCAANDYIQWFPASGYESFVKDKPSELIAEVDFCREFDIMDVLAICWSIHRGPRTRAYTLQRFNCYFLCGTILSILARRLTQWEAGFTRNVWVDTLHQTLDQLTHMSREREVNHLVLHICRLLDPDCQNPTEFIFGALRTKLGTEDVYCHMRRALADTLWRTAWSGRMSRALEEYVNAAVALAIEGEGRSARTFKSAISDPRQVLRERIGSFATVNEIVAKKAVGAVAYGTASIERAFHEHYQMENIEERRPISRELSKRRLGVDRAVESTILVGRTISIDTAITASDVVAQLNCEMADRTLRGTLKELEAANMLTLPDMTAALHIILTKNLWDAWLNKSVLDVLATDLPEMLEEDEEGKILARIAGS
ncbi:hypothetical protein FRC10_011213, partial [Ceratobasidium sp. 414]